MKITIKSFKNVLEFLDTIRFINCGGCGIAAISLYRWLEKNKKLTKNTKFFGFDDSSEEFNNNYNLLTNNGKNNDLKYKLLVSSHYMIFHRNKFYDSNGSHVEIDYRYKYEISEEQLLVLINYPSNRINWNTMFDRNNCKEIEKTLDIDLSDIKIE